jgi:hypothetical protein
MEVACDRCAKKARDSLGDLLVAGWVQKNPEITPGRRGWLCPSCAKSPMEALGSIESKKR